MVDNQPAPQNGGVVGGGAPGLGAQGVGGVQGAGGAQLPALPLIQGGTVGSLQLYEPGGQLTLTSWLQRFETFCIINGVADEPIDAQGNIQPAMNLRRIVFLQYLADRAYQALYAACLPNEPLSRSVPQLVSMLRNKFEPIGQVEANRMELNRIVQREDQSAQDFLDALQMAAVACDLGTSYDLILKNRLLCGIRNDVTRDRVLSQSAGRNFDETKAIFVQVEESRMQSKALARAANVLHSRADLNSNSDCDVNRAGVFRRTGFATRQPEWNSNRGGRGQSSFSVNRGGRSSSSRPSASVSKCWRCGSTHDPNVCRARFFKCFSCGKMGHARSACSKEKVHGVHPEAESGSVDEHVENVFVTAFGKKSAGSSAVLSSAEDSRLIDDIVIQRVEGDLVECTGNQSEPWWTVFLLYLSSFFKSFSSYSLMTFVNFIVFLLTVFGLLGSVSSSVPLAANLRLKHSRNAPQFISLFIDDKPLQFEVDSGAGVSIIPLKLFSATFPRKVINDTRLVLHGVSGKIKVLGEVEVLVKKGNSQPIHQLKLIVCDSPTLLLPLMGRDWLDILTPKWRCVLSFDSNSVNLVHEPSLSSLKVKYPSVFDCDLSAAVSGYIVHLTLRDGAIPVFMRPYSLPFAVMDVVGNMLDKMESDGKIVKVTYSDWASPIFPVKKKSGGFRLCVDLKRTLNPNLKIDVHPLPKMDDIFASLHGGSVFCVIDLSEAYTQLAVDEESQKLLTINTHKGLYQFKRLIYGVASAPALFQLFMDKILLGIPKTVCYLDDILVQGSSLEECHGNVDLVLSRLFKRNVKIQSKKCIWFNDKVEYLGHIISAKGRSPAPSLVEAIVKAPEPKCLKELRSFLGLINFYSSFLPSASTVLKPLRLLCEKNASFDWSADCVEAFKNAKQMLVKSNLLVHFDPSLPITVHTDASPVGVACVLNHVVKFNGKSVERPVLFASCSLTKTQQSYSQLDREALAIIFSVLKLRRYLYGRFFVLVTDNQPIRHIFSPEKGIPIVNSYRLQHWAAILGMFNFKLEHRKAEFLAVPDALSRLPSQVECFIDVNFSTVHIDSIPLSFEDVAEATRKDSVLVRVFDFTMSGWPRSVSDLVLRTYFKARHSLSVDRNCLLFANRVIIPLSLQAHVIKLLHEGHPGIVRMKLLARSVVWWPSLNVDIETFCQNCNVCLKVNFKSASSETYPWPKVTAPFERTHIDFYTFKAITCLIYVDAYSKWFTVCPMLKTNAAEVVSKLLSIFAFWGTPKKIVADNGPPFASDEFKSFCTSMNIELAHSPVYHPQSNNPAERSVQICKKALQKLCLSLSKVTVTELTSILSRFLYAYLNTPTTVHGKTPNQLLLNYSPRTTLSVLNPKNVRQSISSTLPFREGDNVLVRYGKNFPVLEAIIVRALSATRYLVSVQGA